MIYTIGHSNVSMDVFLAALEANRIQTLVDIRTFPSSRHCPQFGQEELRATLQTAGINYAWLKLLGGRRRKTTAYSRHDGLRHPSFRNYADYMETPEFRAGVAELLQLPGRVAYMCSEAVYWRCHRRMVSDYLTYAGVEVRHIAVATGQLTRHVLTEPSRWDGENVIYSAGTLFSA